MDWLYGFNGNASICQDRDAQLSGIDLMLIWDMDGSRFQLGGSVNWHRTHWQGLPFK